MTQVTFWRSRLSVGLAVLLAPLLLITPVRAQSEQTDLDAARQREQQAATELEGSSAAVQAAASALADVAAQLPAAQTQASRARGQLAGAQAKAAAAQAVAARAEEARAAAQAAVDAAGRQVKDSREAVNSLARTAYQRGRLAGLGEVMNTTNPKDALERGELLRSVFQSGTADLARLTDARLGVAVTRAALVAEEQAAAAAREKADAERARAQQVAAEAEVAVERVQALILRGEQAQQAAEANREQDRRDYELAQAASADLAERIRVAAARAAAERAAREKAAAEAAARAARQRSTAPAPAAPQRAQQQEGRMTWPADGRLTSRYGWRTHPIYGDRRLHAGVDIGAGEGVPIVAGADGFVLFSYYTSGYGNLTVVDHGAGLTTSYAHQSSMQVEEGQRVARGQVIGRSGSTGNVTGPHLHFEVRVDGEPVDPLDFVNSP